MYFIFSAVIPVFLVIFAGALTERLELLPHDTSQIMGLFVVNVSMPCLIFHIMAGITLEQLTQGMWWLGTIGVQSLFMALGFLGDRLRGVPLGPSIMAGMDVSFTNVAFVGIPVVMNVLPGNQEALTIAGLCLVVINAIAIPTQVMLEFIDRKGREQGMAARGPMRVWLFVRRYILSNPVVIATIIGLLLAIAEIPLWGPLDRAVTLIGYAAPPVMLFSLGFGIRDKLIRARQSRQNMVLHQIWLNTAKLVLLPLATGMVLFYLGYTGLWVAVPVIISAAGLGVVSAVFAEIYHAAPEETALTVLLSNGLSLFSLMAFIWLVKEYGFLG